jgi:hypothetical protein
MRIATKQTRLLRNPELLFSGSYFQLVCKF